MALPFAVQDLKHGMRRVLQLQQKLDLILGKVLIKLQIPFFCAPISFLASFYFSWRRLPILIFYFQATHMIPIVSTLTEQARMNMNFTSSWIDVEPWVVRIIIKRGMPSTKTLNPLWVLYHFSYFFKFVVFFLFILKKYHYALK